TPTEEKNTGNPKEDKQIPNIGITINESHMLKNNNTKNDNKTTLSPITEETSQESNNVLLGTSSSKTFTLNDFNREISQIKRSNEDEDDHSEESNQSSEAEDNITNPYVDDLYNQERQNRIRRRSDP